MMDLTWANPIWNPCSPVDAAERFLPHERFRKVECISLGQHTSDQVKQRSATEWT